MFANLTSLAIASFKTIVSENTKMKFVKMMIAQFLECSLRHPRKCRYYLEFQYCKFGMYCRFSHQTVKNKETVKEIDELRLALNLMKEKIRKKDKEIELKEIEIESMKVNFAKEMKNRDREELERFEIQRNDLHVTRMLFDDFKEDMTYKYGYDSNAETSEDEIVDETEKKDCDLCNFKGKTEGGLKTHIRRKHKEKNY